MFAHLCDTTRLTFGTQPCWQYFTILQMSLMAYLLLKFDEAALDMENPFYSRGLSKLPLESMCITVEKNLLEYLLWSEQVRRSRRCLGVVTPSLDSRDGAHHQTSLPPRSSSCRA